LRELKARDLNYIAPMAQIKSEILSQGLPSLQISRPSKASPSRLEQSFYCLSIPQMAVRYSRFGVSTTDSIQIRIFSGQGYAPLPVNGVRVAAFKTRSFANQAGVALSWGWEFFKGCSAAFVARASDMPLCGVLGV
jgi:hypothetical protein